MPDVDLFSDCPGYADAARLESELRSGAFLGEPEFICGLPVQPMTARHAILLNLIRSPFTLSLTVEQLLGTPPLFVDGKPNLVNDINAFLWIVCPLFKSGSKNGGKWKWRFDRLTFRLLENRRDKFNRIYSRIMKERSDVVMQQILDYVSRAWMDAGEGAPGERSFYSMAANLAISLNRSGNLPLDCWNNSWGRRLWRAMSGQINPLDVPLRIAFQYARVTARMEYHETPLRNKLSDAAIQKWMAEDQPKPDEKIAEMKKA